jgi:hypothetical protein
VQVCTSRPASRTDFFSRKNIRLTLPIVAMVIDPLPLLKRMAWQVEHPGQIGTIAVWVDVNVHPVDHDFNDGLPEAGAWAESSFDLISEKPQRSAASVLKTAERARGR